MISSSAKMTAATGVLNAADSAAAAATGIRLLARSGDRLNHLPIVEAMPPPICYRRAFAAHRMARTDAKCSGQEFAESHPAGYVALLQVVRSFSLGNAAAARLGEILGQQKSGDQAHQRRDQDVTQYRGRDAEQQVSGAFDGQRKQHCGQPGEHGDQDGQREKDVVLA